MHACRLVQLVNVGHLKAPASLNGMDDDDGFYAVDMSVRVEDTGLIIMRMKVRNTIKIYTGEPRGHG